MAALTAASWTIVITDKYIRGRERQVRGTMEIPGTDTYPTGGIPLPTKEKFGFYGEVQKLTLEAHDPQTTGFAVSWDKTNNKLQLYGDRAVAANDSLLETPNTDVPGPRVWRFEAKGW